MKKKDLLIGIGIFILVWAIFLSIVLMFKVLGWAFNISGSGF